MSEASSQRTPASLLQQLRGAAAASTQDAWRRFVALYTPLLLLWACRVGAGEQDAPDLVQDVFLVLAREMPRFRHDPGQRFRAWLWTILRNKWLDRVRERAAEPAAAGGDAVEGLAVPDNVEEFAEQEYRACLIARAIELMRAELPEAKWRACHEYVIHGRPAAEVARDLGMTVNRVYLAKSRILRRVRQELQDLLD
jgi:RNA polymerase sigma-70 factor (ECF subfamily)